eukprot:gene11477-17657_t
MAAQRMPAFSFRQSRDSLRLAPLLALDVDRLEEDVVPLQAVLKNLAYGSVTEGELSGRTTTEVRHALRVVQVALQYQMHTQRHLADTVKTLRAAASETGRGAFDAERIELTSLRLELLKTQRDLADHKAAAAATLAPPPRRAAAGTQTDAAAAEQPPKPAESAFHYNCNPIPFRPHPSSEWLHPFLAHPYPPSPTHAYPISPVYPTGYTHAYVPAASPPPPAPSAYPHAFGGAPGGYYPSSQVAPVPAGGLLGGQEEERLSSETIRSLIGLLQRAAVPREGGAPDEEAAAQAREKKQRRHDRRRRDASRRRGGREAKQTSPSSKNDDEDAESASTAWGAHEPTDTRRQPPPRHLFLPENDLSTLQNTLQHPLPHRTAGESSDSPVHGTPPEPLSASRPQNPDAGRGSALPGNPQGAAGARSSGVGSPATPSDFSAAPAEGAAKKKPRKGSHGARAPPPPPPTSGVCSLSSQVVTANQVRTTTTTTTTAAAAAAAADSPASAAAEEIAYRQHRRGSKGGVAEEALGEKRPSRGHGDRDTSDRVDPIASERRGDGSGRRSSRGHGDRETSDGVGQIASERRGAASERRSSRGHGDRDPSDRVEQTPSEGGHTPGRRASRGPQAAEAPEESAEDRPTGSRRNSTRAALKNQDLRLQQLAASGSAVGRGGSENGTPRSAGIAGAAVSDLGSVRARLERAATEQEDQLREVKEAARRLVAQKRDLEEKAEEAAREVDELLATTKSEAKKKMEREVEDCERALQAKRREMEKRAEVQKEEQERIMREKAAELEESHRQRLEQRQRELAAEDERYRAELQSRREAEEEAYRAARAKDRENTRISHAVLQEEAERERQTLLRQASAAGPAAPLKVALLNPMNPAPANADLPTTPPRRLSQDPPLDTLARPASSASMGSTSGTFPQQTQRLHHLPSDRAMPRPEPEFPAASLSPATSSATPARHEAQPSSFAMAVCPLCALNVRLVDIADHRAFHCPLRPSAQATSMCNKCGEEVPLADIATHKDVCIHKDEPTDTESGTGSDGGSTSGEGFAFEPQVSWQVATQMRSTHSPVTPVHLGAAGAAPAAQAEPAPSFARPSASYLESKAELEALEREQR